MQVQLLLLFSVAKKTAMTHLLYSRCVTHNCICINRLSRTISHTRPYRRAFYRSSTTPIKGKQQTKFIPCIPLSEL